MPWVERCGRGNNINMPSFEPLGISISAVTVGNPLIAISREFGL